MNKKLILKKAIENLYQVFERYPLDPEIDACPCCVKPKELEKLRSIPLRQQMDLSDYSMDALWTCGGVDDFKHFLPRIFELNVLTEIGGIVWPDIEVVFVKLRTECDWAYWPSDEKEAIRDYCQAAWRYVLEEEEPEHDPIQWLCGIGRAGVDLHPYLDYWVQAQSSVAYEHLAEFVEWEKQFYLKDQKLRNPFWDYAPAHDQFFGWLTNPVTVKQLEEIFRENPSAEYSEPLTRAIRALASCPRSVAEDLQS